MFHTFEKCRVCDAENCQNAGIPISGSTLRDSLTTMLSTSCANVIVICAHRSMTSSVLRSGRLIPIL